jgi:Ca-activated chloride channel family protein
MKKITFMAFAAAIAFTFSSCSFAPVAPGEGYFDDAMGDAYGEPVAGETGDKFEEFTDNPFISTSEEPTSTFSVDADGASYAYMRRYMREGKIPSKSSVRIEEFLNYFTFDYTEPEDAVAINAEVGVCPWDTDHYLLRLGLKGKSVTAEEMAPANYVFLVDISGSMDSLDKLFLYTSALLTLVDQLNPTDRVAIITYAGRVEKVLESTEVMYADRIKEAIRSIGCGGSTAGAQAMKMAYEEALANFIEGGNNRIIMGTDGDFNVGVTDTDQLLNMVSHYADQGIYLTMCGFGTGNLNDEMMEKLSNRGNGTYYHIDSEDEFMKVFVHDRMQLQAVANDTKCQITFDSTRVAQYRLIGYENRVMSNEEFDDDTKDAGEIGAGQTITALYEIVPTVLQSAEPIPYATFDCRYKEQLGLSSKQLTLPVYGDIKSDTENLRFAAGIAAYGMLLRDSEYKGDVNLEMVKTLIGNSLTFDPHGYRAELLDLLNNLTSEQVNELNSRAAK